MPNSMPPQQLSPHTPSEGSGYDLDAFPDDFAPHLQPVGAQTLQSSLSRCGIYGQYAIETMIAVQFLDAMKADAVCIGDTFGVEMSALGFIDVVFDSMLALTGTRPVMQAPWSGHVIGELPGKMIVQVSYSHSLDPIKETRHFYRISVVGLRDLAIRLRKMLQERFGDTRLATVNWLFKSEGRTHSRSIVLEPPEPVYDEFYPYLDEPVASFIDRYMQSSSCILFMMGPPGTGKTSFVRHMVYTHHLSAIMTYDDELLASDGVFVNFMTSDDESLFVIEDADNMLGSRESEGNKMISRFLNVSDGLIKITGKKIIFTTNLNDFSKVDPALIRAGRCFGAVKFRPLTPREANMAAEAAGLPPVDDHDGEDVTLAELFNRNVKKPKLVQIGF